MGALVALRRTACLAFACASLWLPASLEVAAETAAGSAARTLIDGTNSNIHHLDLLVQRRYDASTTTAQPPWFDGFGGRDGVAAVTVGHPIQRILLHLRAEGVGLEEGMSWPERGGKAADASSSYRQGYQQLDNYLVRVLAGKSAWDLPPGRVGKTELQAARIALGKFEVLLRADCLAVDLPLLQPYLAKAVPAAQVADAARETEDLLESGKPHYLVFGKEGGKLLRDNRWDLQLWDFAHKLVESRSTTAEGYLCGSSTSARRQRMPGDGRRAVVYNSPSFHITGVAMFSCVLMSLGFDVTAVVKEPGAGFEDLLPCPDRVVALSEHYLRDLPGEILDEEAAEALSLPESLTADQEEERLRQQALHLERLRKEEEELRKQQELEQQQQEGKGESGHDAADGGATRRRRATAGFSLEGGPREGRDEQQVGGEEGEHPIGREGQKRRGEEAGRQRGPALGGDGDGNLGALDVGVEEGSDREGARATAAVGWGDNSRGLGREELRRRRRRRREEEEESGGGEDVRGTGRRRELTGSEGGGGPRAVDGGGGAGQREGGDGEDRHGSRGLRDAELSGRVSAAAGGDESQVEGGEGRGGGQGRGGPFDLSVLCTAVNDVNHLLKATYPVDPRLADALLWDVDVSIWNVHSVEGAFRSDHRMPPAVDDFARGVQSSAERGGGGRTPPLTFLTLYGEHVEQWERWSEEAYEGWGWDADHHPHPHGSSFSDAETATEEDQGAEERGGQQEEEEEEAGYLDDMERGNSTFGALFRRPGVVYPIHPTGHLRLPRPKRPFAGQQQRRRRHLSGRRKEEEEEEEEEEAEEEEEEAGGSGGESARREEDVVFVVQGNMQSHRRNYPELTRCLEAMCSTGRDSYQLVAVGARGDLPEDVRAMQCVEQRTTEWRHLEYPEFYANISAGHFVVTAAAGHDYEYDKATSTVPTALLLERPLVMSSTLLDAYPCLRKSRVHSMVANDDLCLNLQTAYDLTTEEYDEMELEARDCKLEMWRHARETVAGMASGWTLD